MFVGCDFLSIGIKSSVLGSLTLYPKAGENGQIEEGGITTESDVNGLTGSGSAIYKMKVGRWVVETPPIAWNRQGSDTLSLIQAMASEIGEQDFTFTLADGKIKIGKGKIVGEVKGATFDATIPLKFEGGGKLTTI